MKINIVPEYVTRGLYPNFDDYVEALYLDYFNNYLTVEKFANDYDFNIELANKIINNGRVISVSKLYNVVICIDNPSILSLSINPINNAGLLNFPYLHISPITLMIASIT